MTGPDEDLEHGTLEERDPTIDDSEALVRVGSNEDPDKPERILEKTMQVCPVGHLFAQAGVDTDPPGQGVAEDRRNAVVPSPRNVPVLRETFPVPHYPSWRGTLPIRE